MCDLPESAHAFFTDDDEIMYYDSSSFSSSSSWHHWQHRFLAGKEEDEKRMDYSVLSVGVMTLGLIMVVEVLRHRLDHLALGRPYFTAVLNNIYAELATLGIVEFFVYLLQQYHTNLDKAKKSVFGAVHFALFYTAVFNAFQSIILAFLTMRISRRNWVQTEALELNHYVEIREEFDRVHSKLQKLRGQSVRGAGDMNNDDDANAAPAASIAWSWYRSLVDAIWYPQLKRRYNALLLQVRFHELRVHFVQAYQLPKKLAISDYLIRSQLQVLIKLVHVSTYAWLLLTASANLLYYLLGIVSTKTADPEQVGTILMDVFFVSMGAFIVLAVVVYYKMQSVFKTIMHRRHLWELQSNNDEARQALAKEQLQLFWGASPKWVIASLQFMQFGYAVALSVVIIFMNEIADGDLAVVWYWIAILVCYTGFVAVAAQVIPSYTLCTSMGQLVDRARLHETVAVFHLEEAKRQRLEQQVLLSYENETQRMIVLQPESAGTSGHGIPPEMATASGVKTAVLSGELEVRHIKPESLSIATKDTDSTLDASVPIPVLVPTDTDASRTILPLFENDGLGRGARVRRERRKRIRAVSDGVALMAGLGKAPSAIPINDNDQSAVGALGIRTGDAPERTLAGDLATPVMAGFSSADRRRRRKKSVSDGVAFMANLKAGTDFKTSMGVGNGLLSTDSERIAELVTMDTATLRANLPQDELRKLSERERGRRSRQKSHSDGVDSMTKPRHKSHSDGVEAMANADDTWLPSWPGLGLGAKDRKIDEPRARRQRLRSRRRKAVSDGVAAMAATSPSLSEIQSMATTVGVEVPETVKEEVALNESMTTELVSNQNTIAEEGDLEHTSLASIASSGAHSDVDDVPDVDPTKWIIVKRKSPPTFKERSRKYLLSKRSVVISNVFGTMVSFFLVGARVERFLHTENIVSDDFISFDFNEKTTFWLLSTWMYFFLARDALLFYSFGSFDRLTSIRERQVWVAGVIDCIIVSVCLVVFYSAEAKRCCYPADDSGVSSRASDYDVEPYGAPHGEPAPCECSIFGSRLYGGLGSIEPYTSLISLRLFRSWFSSRIVRYLDSKRGGQSTKEENEQLEKDTANLDPFDVYSKRESHVDNEHGHGKVHQEEETGTAAELWERAIRKYPAIVAKYGEFSGELLLAMLGLPIIEANVSTEETDTNDTVTLDEGATRVRTRSNDATKQSFRLDQQYAELPVDAQEIIMAGKLGRRVKSYVDFQSMEQADAFSDDAEMGSPPSKPVMFEVLPPDHDLSNSFTSFDSPNARLVRGMRRCDRKLLPILGKWTVVDVVMTRFEMVYFDAADIDEDYGDPAGEATRQALAATNGGKGLRLCDVAVGRNVVGQLRFSDITSIVVEREMPSEMPRDGDASNVEVRQIEYWQSNADAATQFLRGDCWHSIKQDSVKVQTSHGHTLYLRFYSDLEDTKNHLDRMEQENEDFGPLYVSNAFHWVKSIGRLCGPEQLKQSLPHFGNDTSDELRDYLVLKSHKQENERRRRPPMFFQRGISFGESGNSSDGSHHGHLRRSSSHGQQAASSQTEMQHNGDSLQARGRSPTRHRRSKSHAHTIGSLSQPSPRSHQRSMSASLSKPHGPTPGSLQPLPPLDQRAASAGTALYGKNAQRDVKVTFETPDKYTYSDLPSDSPDARIVRCMRRCDRKFLPILNAWSVVDVVMTHFEMIYFDATDVDGPSSNSRVIATRDALTSSNGGKGMRLSEVAVERKVVGHLRFSDVVSVHVEREMPSEAPRDGDASNAQVHQNEYWHGKKDQVHMDRDNAWHKIKQDSLKLVTVHGHTLYLRFYSDLTDAEHHPERLKLENEENGVLHKNSAFHWAQTIGRFCGPERLKQPLPHFGQDSSEELRDYLLIKHDSEHGISWPARSLKPSDRGNKRHTREKSLGTGLDTLVIQENAGQEHIGPSSYHASVSS